MSEIHDLPEARDLRSGRVEQLSAHLVAELARERAPRRRRRLAVVLVPAAIALLLATGFTTYSLLREPTHLSSIGCFETASEAGNVAIVDTDGRAPAEICAALWRAGSMGSSPPPSALATCVLSTGAIGVFPGRQATTCASLGLAAVDSATLAELERFSALRRAIVAELGEPPSGSSLGSPKCVGESAARTAVRRALDAHGYGSWTIEVTGDGFTAERPCAEPAFDNGRKAVLLVPAWR